MSVLQSEATPGEDEMNPTVKRSGWHPPEDTGLWAIADRVVMEVSCKLSNLSASPVHSALLTLLPYCCVILCKQFGGKVMDRLHSGWN